MKLMLALASLLVAASAWPCTTPAKGTMEDMMAQAVWSKDVGTYAVRARKTKVTISLPALADSIGWNCLRWTVDIRLPDGVEADVDGDGNAEPTTHSNLTPSQSATFKLKVRRPGDRTSGFCSLSEAASGND